MFHVSNQWALLGLVSLLSAACSPQEAEKPAAESPIFVASESADPDVIGNLPGAPEFTLAERQTLAQALAAHPAGEAFRTRHIVNGRPIYTNRLVSETSPYLRQHAHNPVDWRPWGDEAFAEAKALGRPVFLSVGYSTCHWCHVMEEESFEDPEVAQVINSNFIAIKVDREQRPDVDEVYMRAVQAMNRSGGWPMTVVMTDEREPFFGATYIPPRAGARGVEKGLVEILEELSHDYQNDREGVVANAKQVTQALVASAQAKGGKGMPTDALIVLGAQNLLRAHDSVYGGLGSRTKFPRPSIIRLFLRVHRRTGEMKYLHTAEKTLEAMANGGIRDHVGGGFHRYTTDRKWLVPHFEKMLYDNAQLTTAYLEAYIATGNTSYADVVREILHYVQREMTSAEGAFYSATDADSEGEEGLFFLWTAAELDSLLTPAESLLFKTFYGVTERGNFEGRNILNISKTFAEVVAEVGAAGVPGLTNDPVEAKALLESARAKLYSTRAERIWPLLDDKIITSWNALMVSALAQAGLALDEPRYIQRAEKAADFLLDELVVDGRIKRSWHNGRLSGEGYLDDYSALVGALLDLFEATGDTRWLRQAVALQSKADEFFMDKAHGGYFYTASDQEGLLFREKPYFDKAVPSGNSLMAENLVRLAEFTSDDRWGAQARALFAWSEPQLQSSSTGAPRLLSALDFELDRAREIVLVGGSDEEIEPFLSVLRSEFLPNRVLIRGDVSALEAMTDVVPLVEGKRAMSGKPTAYVCEQGRCELPATDAKTFQQQVSVVTPYRASPAKAGDPQ